MQKLLIICGPTATGKTALGISLAKKFNGEIISADSRQVYARMDIVTGKGLPPGINPVESSILWHHRNLKFYELEGVKVWGYDIVKPTEDFNVSFWKECADTVLADIRSREKLPIIVGGTGLYIKSLTKELSDIIIPQNLDVRKELENQTAEFLFNYLNELSPVRASGMNASDKNNPRRLIRAIEVIQYKINLVSPSTKLGEGDLPAPAGKGGEVLNGCDFLLLGLTAPLDYLKHRVDMNIQQRITAGAESEAQGLVNQYGYDISSMTSCGYRSFKEVDWQTAWKNSEYHYLRRQLTWFKKQPEIYWFDISIAGYQDGCFKAVQDWYNKS